MKALRFLFILLLICSLPMCAFAMDEGYLSDSTKWQSNNEVVYTPEQNIGSYKGIYNYYSDVANNCFYLQLSYGEGSLENSGNEIYLQFNIKNDAHEYQLRIDESGFINSGDYAPKTFNVEQNFGEASEQGQVIYIGIEFLNKDDKKLNNYLSFSLVVKNHTYDLCDKDIKLAYGDYAESQTTTKPTTTKPSTSKPSTTNESTTKESTAKETTTKQTTTKKETTTKFKYTYTTTTTQPTEKTSNTATEKTAKPKTETTTKFKYEGTASSASSEGYNQDSAVNGTAGESNGTIEENTTDPGSQSETIQNENTIIIPATNSAAERSPQAKLLTAAAVICAVAGSAIIVRNLPKKKATNETIDE